MIYQVVWRWAYSVLSWMEKASSQKQLSAPFRPAGALSTSRIPFNFTLNGKKTWIISDKHNYNRENESSKYQCWSLSELRPKLGEEDVRIVVLSLTFPEEVLSSAQNIKTVKSDLVLASCDSYIDKTRGKLCRSPNPQATFPDFSCPGAGHMQ